jgi:hypothetical protein
MGMMGGNAVVVLAMHKTFQTTTPSAKMFNIDAEGEGGSSSSGIHV